MMRPLLLVLRPQSRGAEPSQQTTADFTASVAAVAESPTLSTQTLTGSEDSHTSLEISNSIINAVSNDLDGSEAISQYVISGLTTDAGETFLIVDSSQNRLELVMVLVEPL